MGPGPFDLAIVGAGILGASAAFFAMRHRPDWRIVLCDRSLVGQGATGYSVGLDFPFGQTPYKKRLALESRALYAELRADIPELPVRHLPVFLVVRGDRVSTLTTGLAAEVAPATGEQMAALKRSFPDLRLSSGQVVLAGCPGSYGVAPRVASILVDRFRREGRGLLLEGVEIRRIRHESGTLALVTADGRDLPARRAFVATGPWLLDGPGGEAARQARIRIKKVAALHVDLLPKPGDPILFFFDDDAFLLPLSQRREWVFSFASREWDCVPEISQLHISADDRALALEILGRYCPSWVDRCRGGRVFCDAYSEDRAPVVRLLPGAPEVVLAGACSGSGYRLAPAVALEGLGLLPGFTPELLSPGQQLAGTSRRTLP